MTWNTSILFVCFFLICTTTTSSLLQYYAADKAYYFEYGNIKDFTNKKDSNVNCVCIIGSKNLYLYFPEQHNRREIIPLSNIIEVYIHGYNHHQIVFVHTDDVSGIVQKKNYLIFLLPPNEPSETGLFLIH